MTPNMEYQKRLKTAWLPNCLARKVSPAKAKTCRSTRLEHFLGGSPLSEANTHLCFIQITYLSIYIYIHIHYIYIYIYIVYIITRTISYSSPPANRILTEMRIHWTPYVLSSPGWLHGHRSLSLLSPITWPVEDTLQKTFWYIKIKFYL